MTAMRIGIDLGLCTAAYGGIGRYVEELTRALLSRTVDERDRDEFVLFAGDRQPGWLPGILANASPDRAASRASLDVRYTHRWHAAIRGNVFLGPQLSRLGIRVFHAPDTLGFPLAAPRRVACVVTIHDLIPQRFPQTVTRGHRAIRCAVLPRVVARADLVIADSQATARDIADWFPTAETKTRVVYLGVDERFAPAPGDAVAAVRQRFGLPSEYLLYAGVISPVKNLDRLFEAYAMLTQADQDTPPLVVAGRLGWLHEGIVRKVRDLGLTSRVLFPGFITDEALPALMTGAFAFLFPSLYEGFGLPILEAMACGTPVVTSDRSSLPEVAGGAAELVDPEQPESIADGIRALMQDSSRRRQLRQCGIERARLFRWEETARHTMNAYHEAAESVASR
jgi:glycosyltransferase involved in cell wall biosynthesis